MPTFCDHATRGRASIAGACGGPPGGPGLSAAASGTLLRNKILPGTKAQYPAMIATRTSAAIRYGRENANLRRPVSPADTGFVPVAPAAIILRMAECICAHD